MSLIIVQLTKTLRFLFSERVRVQKEQKHTHINHSTSVSLDQKEFTSIFQILDSEEDFSDLAQHHSSSLPDCLLTKYIQK